MLDTLTNRPLFAASAPYRTLSQNPLGFLDIGARGGVHPLVEPLARLTAILGFEPDKAECDRLQAEMGANSPWAAWEIEPQALGAQEGEQTLYLLSAPTNHSLLSPNRAFTQRYNMGKHQQVGSESLSVVPLDRILFEDRSGQEYWGELMKLDTQGTEFEIFQGAQRTLDERTVALLVEVEFFPVYEGRKLFSEVELFLRERGFSFYGFTSLNYRSCKSLDKVKEAGRERLMWADAVFLKDPLAGGWQKTPLSDRGHHVLFACALLLGYYDFALELALETWAEGEEAQRIEALVREMAARSPSQSYQEALDLADRVRAKPELANLEVGRFVDGHRHLCNYDDVPNSSHSKEYK